MDLEQYVQQWRDFAKKLERSGRFEVASKIVRPYTAAEIAEMEDDLSSRFDAPGFRIPEPLRGLLGVTLSLRVQWVFREAAAPIAGSVRLTPQDVFETEAESGVDHVDFWETDRVFEPITDDESVVAVMAAPTEAPRLWFVDGEDRWPLDLSIEQYLAEAWRFKGLYGWQRALATGGDTPALEQRLSQALAALST